LIYNLTPSTHSVNALRIGFFGGTFDPPHNGHLLVAQKAIEELGLEEVNFAPSRLPPHKIDNDLSPIMHRVEMTRLAIQANPRFLMSYIDVDREGPTYSVDALKILREGWHESTEIYFLMGMDSLANILTWHQPDALIQLCKLAVFARPGFIAPMDELEQKLPGLRERTVFVNAPPLEISATEIQRRVRAGESIKDLVPAHVAEYIRLTGLYQGGNT
jgi:nicotinate-nucleotide adenylyltransferase